MRKNESKLLMDGSLKGFLGYDASKLAGHNSVSHSLIGDVLIDWIHGWVQWMLYQNLTYS